MSSKFKCKISGKFIDFLLIASITIIIFIVIILFWWSVSGGHIFPKHEDETIYFNSARLFYETNSLRAVSCISEQRSFIGQHNWYGPAYQIIYGLLAKVFGLNNVYFIVFHFSLFLGSFFLIFALNLKNTKKLFFASIFLPTYAAFSFIFTYYPEAIHIFISISLLVIYSNLGKFPKWLLAFIFLVLMFSFIRITTVFWIFSILFIPNSLYSFRFRSLIAGLVFFTIIIYMKLFTAPAYSGINAFSTIHNGNIFEIDFGKIVIITLKNIFSNIVRIFKYFHPSVILILVLIIISFYKLIKFKDRSNIFSLIGLFVVVFTTFFTLISFYTTSHFFFEKQTAFLIPLLLFIIVSCSHDLLLYAVLSFFILLPLSIFKSFDNIKSRKLFYNEMKKHSEFKNNILNLKEYLEPNNSEINILYSYSEYSIPNNMMSCFLPISVGKTPILYTTNIVNEDSSIDKKFKLYGRLRIDYILSKSCIDFPFLNKVYENSNYHLYKVKY